MIVGNEFDVTNIKNIKNGRTTRSDVLQLFGQPESKTVNSGKESWQYLYAVNKTSSDAVSYVPYASLLGKRSTQKENKLLMLVFDRDVLKECTFSYGSSSSEFKNSAILTGNYLGKQTAPTTQVTEPCGD